MDITMAAPSCKFLDTFYKDTKIEMVQTANEGSLVTILVLHAFLGHFLAHFLGHFFGTLFGTLYWDTFWDTVFKRSCLRSNVL